MTRQWLPIWVAGWLFVVGASGAETGPQPPTVRPEYTRRSTFSIPFFLNQQARRPDRVQLFVSGDRGESWQPYEVRRPEDRSFGFRAARDGEYWFVVRTNLDRPPQGSDTPAEKIVVIDRQKPSVQVKATAATGIVTAHWTIHDEHLDPRSLTLSYRPQNSSEDWAPVANMGSTPVAGRSDWDESTTWPTDISSTPWEVRVVVADLCGNREEITTVTIASDAGTAGDSRELAPTENSQSVTTSESPTDPPRNAVESTPSNNSPSHPADTDWTATATDDDTHRPEKLPAQPTAFSASNGSTGTSSPDVPVAVPNSPTDRAVQYTNSPRFELDYELREVRASDVARVELWKTLDEGRTWQAHGTDEDRSSPFVVEATRDGLYGFRLLIHNQQGQAAPPPQPGDVPDVWICVDQTAPQMILQNASVTQNGDRRELVVQWQASDENLGDTPITVAYAPANNGPWSALGAGLANAGTCRIPLTIDLPPRTYLQIQIEDRAGNRATAQTPQPIDTLGMRPQGVIRSFRPLSRRPLPTSAR